MVIDDCWQEHHRLDEYNGGPWKKGNEKFPDMGALAKKLEEKGVIIANVTLHVGIGTFRPVKEDTVEKHEMHSEHFYIKQENSAMADTNCKKFFDLLLDR